MNGAVSRLLALQELTVQLGRLFLHFLERRQAFARLPKGLLEGRRVGGGRRLRRRNGAVHRGGWPSIRGGARLERGYGGGRRSKRRAGRLRLAVVGAADRDEERRLTVAGRRARPGAAVPGIHIDAVTEGRQAGHTTRQVVDAGAPAVRRVQCQRLMFPAAQDGADHRRQPGAGADFEKRANAGTVQVFDLGEPLHRPRQLPGQKVAGQAGVVGVGRGRGVGVNGSAGTNFRLLQGGAEGRFGAGHLRAVKRRRH